MGKYEELFERGKSDGTNVVKTPIFQKWTKPGELVIGRYIDVSQAKGQKVEQTYNMYVFETDGGLVKFSCSSQFDKDCFPLMEKSVVYAIEYLRDQKTKMPNSMRIFSLTEIRE